MAAIQIISGYLGWQTGCGLARNISQRLSPWVLYVLVALLVVANTINIAADLAAMGEAVRLVAGGRAVAYALGLGLLCLAAEIFIPYHRYAGYLKLLTFVLLVYVAVAFTVEVPWRTVLVATLLPSFALGRDEMLMVVAIFGTTISPYLFFWQSLAGGGGSAAPQNGQRRQEGPRQGRSFPAIPSTHGSAWPSPIQSASSSW